MFSLEFYELMVKVVVTLTGISLIVVGIELFRIHKIRREKKR